MIIENILQFVSVISWSRGGANKLFNTQTCFTCIILSCPDYPEQVLSWVSQLFGSTCTGYPFVFLPELPERMIHAKWMFSYIKTPCNFTWSSSPVMLWKKRLEVLGEREINEMSSSLYILHKWHSVVFLESVQLFAYMVLKDSKTRTFIILLTDNTYFKVLLVLALYQLYWVNCYMYFIIALILRQYNFGIWYHTLFLAANSGELIILILAPGF